MTSGPDRPDRGELEPDVDKPDVDEPDVETIRRIEIVGDVVRRPAAAWTPTVHALLRHLRHLRSKGLACVPEPLGIDGDTETLGLSRGCVGARRLVRPTLPRRAGLGGQAAPHGPRRVGGLVPSDGAVWAAPPVAVTGDAERVLCHGDPGPWNYVWRGDHAVELLDWDFLHPGPRVDDLAYALRWFTPARHDEQAEEVPISPGRAGTRRPTPPTS